MSLKDYYLNELTALRQDGKRFSERNPALAGLIGDRSNDPDIERLVESFAFLTGRLRQKLDDDLPELTHSLMNLLWPGSMRPFPSCSTVQYNPLKNGDSVHLPRGEQVNSEPVQGIPCRFRTTSATDLWPLQLQDLEYSVTPTGVQLSLKLMQVGDKKLNPEKLRELRLHLAGNSYVSQTLYLDLLNYLSKVEVVLLGADGQLLAEAGAQQAWAKNIDTAEIRPSGFDEEQGLIPYPQNAFRGYRYLQEYFAFMEKFLYVDVGGLGALALAPAALRELAYGFELRFYISKPSPEALQATLDNVRLYCAPVVNLFSQDATPIKFDGKQERYLLLPQVDDPRLCAVYSVDRVGATSSAHKDIKPYVLFESFEHDHTHSEGLAYYSARQQQAPGRDSQDTYLSFSSGGAEHVQTMSVELTCTNQHLPALLKIGAICKPGDGSAKGLSFVNISRATPSYAPPLHTDYLWKLVSNLALNYLSLADINALRVVLGTYDLPRHYDQKASRNSARKLSGLLAISHTYISQLFEGLPVRGIRSELHMDPEHFECEGAMYLFACVLNEFFALYTSINSFHQLNVTTTKGQEYTWSPRMGQQALI